MVISFALAVDQLPTLTDDVSLLVFFGIGLLGGAHCLGMCGPLVTMYADRLGGRSNALSWGELRQHALFNIGRTLSYAVIGGIMGAIGSLVFDAAAVLRISAGVRATTGIAVGAAIIAVGFGYIVRGTSPHAGSASSFLPVSVLTRPFTRAYAVINTRVDRWVRGPRIVGLGMVHGLLPCPLLYPAFLYALARGSPLEGMIALGALGLGTFPTLFLYGTAFQSVTPTGRTTLHRALGIAFVALGYVALSHGLAAAGIEVPHLHIPIYQPLE